MVLNDVDDFLHDLQAEDELQELDDAIDEPINLEDDEESCKIHLPGIPATSAPSKRVFSTAGLTIAKDRAQLEASRANEIVFLHDSLPALCKYTAVISKHNQTVIDV
jgi:hypothetical protein